MSRGELIGIGIGLIGALAPLVILWLHKRSLANGLSERRQPTDVELKSLRQRAGLCVAVFILFWVVSVGLVIAAELVDAVAPVKWAVLAIILLMAALSAAVQLSIRCPICGYRIGCRSPFALPEQCERCTTKL